MKVVLKISVDQTYKFKKYEIVFGSWSIGPFEKFGGRPKLVTLTEHNKQHLISPIFIFFRRCCSLDNNNGRKLYISNFHFKISRKHEDLRRDRCNSLLNSGRITFDQFRSLYAYRYPIIHNNSLRWPRPR